MQLSLPEHTPHKISSLQRLRAEAGEAEEGDF